MERLNLIVVCCGETFVSTNEWACNATIAHTREIFLYSRYVKECYRHDNDISTHFNTVAPFSRVTRHYFKMNKHVSQF